MSTHPPPLTPPPIPHRHPPLAAAAPPRPPWRTQVVNLVRGQLGSLERATCGSLVVIDVHARDVVAAMAKDGVEDPRDFKCVRA